MKTKKKNFVLKLKHSFLFLGVLLILTSCEKETESIEDTTSTTKREVSASIIRGSALEKEEKLVLETIFKYLPSKENSSRGIYVSEYGFSIDTTSSLKMEASDFTSYTFEIRRDYAEQNVLENYVLTTYPDGSFMQYLVKYFYQEDGTYNPENTEYTLLEGDQLVSRGSCTLIATEEWVETGDCINVPCQDVVGHAYGDSSCTTSPEYQAYQICDGAWVTQFSHSCDDGGSSGGGEESEENPDGNSSGTSPHGYFSPANVVIRTLGYTSDLNQDEMDWLYQHNDTEAIEIRNLLTVTPSPEDIDLAKMYISISLVSSVEGPFDAIFFNSIDSYFELDLTDPGLMAKFHVYFSAKCAILKLQNPEWSTLKVYWEAMKEMVHIGLDLAGLVPVFGEVCDLANGVIYALEGDGVNATLSFAATIPILGWFSTGAKYAYKTVVFANGTKGTYKWIVKANGIIDFGKRNSSRFRKAIGLPSGDPRQAHHLISRAQSIINHDVVQKAAKHFPAFHIDEALNGIAVAAWRNQPNHNLYNQRIFDRLEELNSSSLTNEQAYNALTNLMTEIRGLIQNNPNLHLNDLIF